MITQARRVSTCTILPEATDTRVVPHQRPPQPVSCGITLTVLLLAAAGRVSAQDVSGSMRLDYQSTAAANVGNRVGILAQQYYVRAVDRLFVKNLVVFTGNFSYRTGQVGQPVDFRPRYDLQLSSTGYSARVGYEPYTLRRGSVSQDERNRQWRSSLYVNPEKWPRLGFDHTRLRQERGSTTVARDDWSAYRLDWQPGSRTISSSYSRQVRTPRDSLREMIETYRALAATDHALPGNGRISLSYNFDRSWRERTGFESQALDQHVPTASASLQPSRWLALTTQYSGRYVIQSASGDAGSRHSNDQLASGSLTLSPSSNWSLGATRFFEKTADRSGQDAHNTDYWQVRASTDRVFYRQIRGQFTVYRIAYSGAGEGLRFSDAYFAALRGRPHRHAELSLESSLADRHGLQDRRYAVNVSSYFRLYPIHGSQAQVSYNAIAEGRELSNFDITGESFAGSLQYNPDPNLSLTGGGLVRRNRQADAVWGTTWNATATYRWPSFANASVYYTRRPAQGVVNPLQPAGGAGLQTWIATVDWWIGPSTTASVNYSRYIGGGTSTRDLWGIGFATQF